MFLEIYFSKENAGKKTDKGKYLVALKLRQSYEKGQRLQRLIYLHNSCNITHFVYYI